MVEGLQTVQASQMLPHQPEPHLAGSDQDAVSQRRPRRDRGRPAAVLLVSPHAAAARRHQRLVRKHILLQQPQQLQQFGRREPAELRFRRPKRFRLQLGSVQPRERGHDLLRDRHLLQRQRQRGHKQHQNGVHPARL